MRHLLQGALALSVSVIASTLAVREFMEAHKSAIIEGVAIVTRVASDVSDTDT